MKKILTFFFCVTLLFSCLAPLWVSAETQDGELSSDLTSEKSEAALSFSCVYDPERATIEINGTTNHSTMVSNSKDSLVVYALAPGVRVSELASSGAQPIAQSAINIKFHFSVKINSVIDQYSRYAIFLCSPDGILTLAAEPKYATIASENPLEIGNKEYYKGITTHTPSLNGELAAGSTVIPVLLEELFAGDVGGYPYQIGERVLIFNAAYVDQLDEQIRNISVVGGRVYLQFLLSAHSSSLAYADSRGTDAKYDLPDVSADAVLQQLEGAAGFLASRYSNARSGHIHGIVVGKGMDQPSVYQYAGDISTERYLELYTLYMIALTNGARAYQPAIETVISLTNANTYATDGEADAPTMLEKLLVMLESCVAGEFSLTTLIETDVIPLGITNETLQNGIDLNAKTDSSLISAENVSDYTAYLKTLQKDYTYAPNTYMLLWAPPKTLTGNALSCAYTYSYFLLLQEQMLTSFVVSLETNGQITDLKQIMKYIDTQDSMRVTERLLPYFGVSRWGEVVNTSGFLRRSAYSATAWSEVPTSCIGSFVYEDYSPTVAVENWIASSGCGQIRSETNRLFGDRVLRMDMKHTVGTYSEALCIYETEESFAYTPYLAFTVGVTDNQDDQSYEIKITIGNGADCLESTYAMRSGSVQQMVLDLRCFATQPKMSFIRVSARRLSDGKEDFSVLLRDITGHSADYTSEELEALIREDRKQNRPDEQASSTESNLAWIMFTVILVTASVAFGVLIWLYRSESNRDTTS